MSAVSPDCETNIYKESFLNLFFRYLNSDAISIVTSSPPPSAETFPAESSAMAEKV